MMRRYGVPQINYGISQEDRLSVKINDNFSATYFSGNAALSEAFCKKLHQKPFMIFRSFCARPFSSRKDARPVRASLFTPRGALALRTR
ncbi:hypothetical protein [Novacetimonas pomaceti]|uniref:hypothetical protein n=1 Tax=Novacetimonas pomaceti TaxID=2021998 RepID=UPI001057FCC9|nr:hypothetical protein [Novacetimonas pomaceti]